MPRQMIIPENWALRIPGHKKGSLHLNFPNANSQYEAASELVKFGIPLAAAQGFTGDQSLQPGVMTLGELQQKVAITQANPLERILGPDFKATSPPPTVGAGDDLDAGNPSAQLTDINPPGTRFLPGDYGGNRLYEGEGQGPAPAPGAFDGIAENSIPEVFNPDGSLVNPDSQIDPVMQGAIDAMLAQNSGLTKQQAYEQVLKTDPRFASGNTTVAGTDPSLPSDGALGQSADINEIIALFFEDGPYGKAVTTVEGIEKINPLLDELLMLAEASNGRITDQQLQDSINTTQLAVAEFNKEAEVESARLRGASDEEIAAIYAAADQNIARITGNSNVESAQATAGGATPYGFLQQGGSLSDLDRIFDRLNEVGLTEANPYGFTNEQGFGLEQGRVSNNPFSFLQQNQQSADSRGFLDQVLRGGLSPEQQRQLAIANQAGQMQGNYLNFIGNPSAVGFATEAGLYNPSSGGMPGQPEQFNPTMSGGMTRQPEQFNEQAQRLWKTQGPENLYQTGEERRFTEMPRQTESALNPAMQGSLRNQAIQKGDLGQTKNMLHQSFTGRPQMTKNMLQGMTRQPGQLNPTTQGGLRDPAIQQVRQSDLPKWKTQGPENLYQTQGPITAEYIPRSGGVTGQPKNLSQNILRDISNSPEGNLPGSLFGFNPPSASGAGGGNTTNTGNFNANTLRNASNEQIGFLQGAASAHGETPSEFNQKVQKFTPQGV